MDRKTKEHKLLTLMIGIYCRKKHSSKELCVDCINLLEYAKLRSENCPFKENKTFCSNCKIHCYRSCEREKIRAVMKFSGPWMLVYHPIVAIQHIAETIKSKATKHNT